MEQPASREARLLAHELAQLLVREVVAVGLLDDQPARAQLLEAGDDLLVAAAARVAQRRRRRTSARSPRPPRAAGSRPRRPSRRAPAAAPGRRRGIAVSSGPPPIAARYSTTKSGRPSLSRYSRSAMPGSAPAASASSPTSARDEPRERDPLGARTRAPARRLRGRASSAGRHAATISSGRDGEPAGDVGENVERRAVGPLQVVHEQHAGRGAGERRDERLRESLVEALARARPSLGRRAGPAGELGHEPRGLARARGHRRRAARPSCRSASAARSVSATRP